MRIRHPDICSIRLLLQSPVKKRDREPTTTLHRPLLADLNPPVRQRRTGTPLLVQGVPAVVIAPAPPRRRPTLAPVKTDFHIAASICLPPPLTVPHNDMALVKHRRSLPLRPAGNHTRTAKVPIEHQQQSRLPPPATARGSPASIAI